MESKVLMEKEPDYYFLPDGRMVFTGAYHLKRGYCCGSACRHCPYDYEAVPEPRRSRLLEEQLRGGDSKPDRSE